MSAMRARALVTDAVNVPSFPHTFQAVKRHVTALEQDGQDVRHHRARGVRTRDAGFYRFLFASPALARAWSVSTMATWERRSKRSSGWQFI